MKENVYQNQHDGNETNQIYDESAERAVIGSMLRDYDFIDLCASYLTESDFYIDTHQKLFRAIIDYRVKYAYFDNIDFTLLINFIREKNIQIHENDIEALVLEGIDDTDILLAIFDILRQKRKEREIIQLSKELEKTKDINTVFSYLYENAQENIFRYDSFDDVMEIKQTFLCKNYLPLAQNTLTLLSAHGGTGKTWLALNIAIHSILEGARVLYWTKEDSAGYLKSRTNILIENFYANKRDVIRQNLYFSDSSSAISSYHFFLFEKNNFDLLILDPLLSFFMDNFQNENDNVQARKFISMLVQEAQKRRITTLLIHHHNKSKDSEMKARGASAFLDSARLAYEILPIPRDKKKKITYDIHTEREISVVKDNFGVSAILGGFSKVVKIKPAPNFPELVEKELTEPEREETEEKPLHKGGIKWR